MRGRGPVLSVIKTVDSSIAPPSSPSPLHAHFRRPIIAPCTVSQYGAYTQFFLNLIALDLSIHVIGAVNANSRLLKRAVKSSSALLNYVNRVSLCNSVRIIYC